MLYVMSVNIEDGEIEYGEDVHFASSPETYLGDACGEFLGCFAGTCSYCNGDSLCADCRGPYYGGAIRSQFLKSDGNLTVHIPGDHRSFRIDIKPVEPILIHVLNGRVEWVRHLPNPDWPWDVTYEWTSHACTRSVP